MRNTSNRRPRSGKTVMQKPPLMAVLWGLVIACIVTAVGLMVGAYLLDQAIISGGASQYLWIITIVSMAAMVTGGGYAAHKSEEKPILMAAAVGGLYVLLRIVISYAVNDGIPMNMEWWVQMLLALGASLLGALMGKRRK